MKFVHIADMHFDAPFVVLNSRTNWGEIRRIEQRDALKKIINYIKEKHPELNDLYNKIYTKKDMSYWEGLDKKVQEYADKNGFMYVIDEEPFLKNPTGKPIIINYFYHEKIRRLSKNK